MHDSLFKLTTVFVTVTAAAIILITSVAVNLTRDFVDESTEIFNSYSKNIQTEEDFDITDETIIAQLDGLEEYTVTFDKDTLTQENPSVVVSESAEHITHVTLGMVIPGIVIIAWFCIALGFARNIKRENEKTKEQEQDPYCSWKRTLTANITKLNKRRADLKQHMSSVDNVLTEIITLCHTIYRETDSTEYNTGDLSKINTYYLPTLYKLTDNLCKLYEIEVDTNEIKTTKKQLEDTIIASKAVFVNMVKSSLEKDILDISAEAAVFNTKTAQVLSSFDMKSN